MNRYGPRLALDLLTLPRQLVQALAVLLQRRVHRRHLLDVADESGDNRLPVGKRELRHLGFADDRAIGIAGIR